MRIDIKQVPRLFSLGEEGSCQGYCGEKRSVDANRAVGMQGWLEKLTLGAAKPGRWLAAWKERHDNDIANLNTASPRHDPVTFMAAYQRGLLSHFGLGRVRVRAPAFHHVLHPANLNYNQELRALWRRNAYDVSFDRNFAELAAIGSAYQGWGFKRQRKIKQTHCHLFDCGLAHSFEIWNAQGAMVGGGYGVAAGDVFILEGLYCRDITAAIFGLTVFARHLAQWGFGLLDATIVARKMVGMGFKPMARAHFNALLSHKMTVQHPSPWSVDSQIYSPQKTNQTRRHLFAGFGQSVSSKPLFDEKTRIDLLASLELTPDAALQSAQLGASSKLAA